MIKTNVIIKSKKSRFSLSLFSFLLAIATCNFSCHNNNESADGSTDTISTSNNEKTGLVNIYFEDERKCMDSISSYNLDSIHLVCLKYLYVLYGRELINNPYTGKKVSIGECNIKLGYFESKHSDIKLLGYHVFINDSLPAELPIISSWGTMISGFYVNTKNKEIINATDEGDETEIKIPNLQKLFNSALKNPAFKNYIETNKNHLHTKFISLLRNLKESEKN